MTKEEYLELIQKMNLIIKHKTDELEELETLSTKTTQENDGMPHAIGISDKVGNGTVKIVMKKQEINETIDVFVDLKAEIINQMQRLPRDEYEILYLHYAKDMGIFEIAEAKGKSDTWVKTRRKRGIQNIEILRSESYRKACGILFPCDKKTLKT